MPNSTCVASLQILDAEHSTESSNCTDISWLLLEANENIQNKTWCKIVNAVMTAQSQDITLYNAGCSTKTLRKGLLIGQISTVVKVEAEAEVELEKWSTEKIRKKRSHEIK